MTKIISTITTLVRKISSLRMVSALLVLFSISYVTINGKPFGLAQLQEITNGVSIPDMEMFGYSPQHVYDILTAQGEAGRSFYLYCIIPQDFPFPLLGALFFATTLTYLAQQLLPADHPLQHIGLLGLCGGLADWGENLCLLTMLVNYPQRLDALAILASIFTVAKTTLDLVSMGMILIGLGWFLVRTTRALWAKKSPVFRGISKP